MGSHLTIIDWSIIGLYLVGLVLFAIGLSARQENREDYYVGGRQMGSWPIAISIMATQCSTNSILGAPAFVAFAAGGGLIWLQYELAVPLAMILLILVFMPLFRKLQLVSVYGYLEKRFGLGTRLTLSALFQFVRAFGTAVTVYSIALVVDLITGSGFLGAVILLGVFTVIYDVFGGIRGVIYSDVMQMVILVSVLLLLSLMLINEAGGLGQLLTQVPPERRSAIAFDSLGITDGQTFAFWPMLFGGFFLYVSYYGCDQSQAQRTLCARDLDTTNMALFLNGLLRFPLVALYCFLGLGIAAYAQQTPEFLDALPSTSGSPNYNLAVPLYILQKLPNGLIGVALVALFAAAMSSLDSALNSLSATTMEDFVWRFHQGSWSAHTELWVARGITILWGCITLIMAFFVEDIASTVLEAINKIGSLANGPVLAVFALGIFTKRANGTGAITGLLSGFAFNLVCWQFLPKLSWLWWNVFGFVTSVAIGYGVSCLIRSPKIANLNGLTWRSLTWRDPGFRYNWRIFSAMLLGWFGFLFVLLIAL